VQVVGIFIGGEVGFVLLVGITTFFFWGVSSTWTPPPSHTSRS